ncbi:hypothetical protein Nepgr_003713 [Nepenthes gracilis]|uniref:Uncharacterized protein n=1 Tax=Nepenthes gracilis TaxID=150966 RepID=A0AAD3XE13_NEPGR|nr:hypothetical protein Nepgr_003713 [Nepenthes gracilis]
MQSFKEVSTTNSEMMYCQSSFFLRGDEINRNNRFLDVGELEHPVVFHQHDAVDLSRSGIYNMKSSNASVPSSLYFGALNANLGASNLSSPAAGVVDAGELLIEKRTAATPSAVAVPVNGHFENWAESAMADTSQQTDTSADVDTDGKNQYRGENHGTIVVDSTDQSKEKTNDSKNLRRLAQNREAARKSRLRKKAYVQRLENSRVKLTQLEQELERARQQGIFIAAGFSGDKGGHSAGGNGALAFDLSYSRWLDDHQRLINDLRSSINSHASDEELRVHVDGVMLHHEELYRLKSVAAKADIFHMLAGMWKTPAERCFMWLGGFRSSELLKILVNHLEPLTEPQLVGICNLQQSSQQAEDALSQGLEALQQSLVETLSSNCLGPSGSGNVANYMGQMAIAMSKLATLENFVHQADLLRQQTWQQMHRILTTRQAARALLVIHDYKTRLRALSSLWLARPKNS